MKPDLTEIKNAAYSRWPEIHAALGIPAKLLNTRKHQPCPHCGGKDRFRYTDHKHGGGYICNRCAPEGGSGFDLLMLVFCYSFTESVNQVSALLGHYPALLAAIEREGELQGLHITYLQADYPKPCGEDGLHAPEWRKLAASHPDTGETLPAKKMKARYAGALNGAAVHLGTPAKPRPSGCPTPSASSAGVRTARAAITASSNGKTASRARPNKPPSPPPKSAACRAGSGCNPTA